ncbi:MAG: VWA domain-containing protein, partial [Spirochaetes bacterium]|nr:VWA domain-containing protein [Spirochaetota bacterium]
MEHRNTRIARIGAARGTLQVSARSLLFALLLLSLTTATAFAQSLTISQIDSSRLLTRQRVDLYVSLTNARGEPVDGAGSGDFQVLESANGEDFTEVPLIEVDADATATEGISFFLLVDNSGSMYDTLAGEATEEAERRRIAHVRRAIRTFLSEIDNPQDRVGLASFNTFYTVHSKPSRDQGLIESLLGEIERPERAAAYTELYAGVRAGVDDLAVAEGRKVLIVLSDGENYPYAPNEGSPHPEYGERILEYGDGVERAQREGVSVFGVSFGPQGDSNLDKMATETGGRVYDARNQDELAAVYADIRRRVLEEYRLSYRPTAEPAERKYVRLRYEGTDGSAQTTRFYFADTIFGTPAEGFTLLWLLPLLLAFAGWWAIQHARFLNRRRDANLEVIGGRTQIFPLESAQTVVGTSEQADVTVAGTGS